MWIAHFCRFWHVDIHFCGNKTEHIKPYRNVDAYVKLCANVQLTCEEADFTFGNKTESTCNHVKCLSSHVNSTFPNVDLNYHAHVKRTCENVHKCAIHMWRHTFPDMETGQRRLKIMWNICPHMWIAHFCKFSHVDIKFHTWKHGNIDAHVKLCANVQFTCASTFPHVVSTHTFPDMATKQRRLEIMWNVCVFVNFHMWK